MKGRAFVMMRRDPGIRSDAFMAGLKACGYETRFGAPETNAQRGDVLVIWSRYAEHHAAAEVFEKKGGTVLVAENGYLGAGGTSPKLDLAGGMRPEHYMAIGVGYHNDERTVQWTHHAPKRFQRLGVDLKPWRQAGDYILLCPNRAFGAPGRLMPAAWPVEVEQRLKKLTKRPVKLRPHPGNHLPRYALEDDLKNAWAVVIWSSSAGVHALAAGIPVVCEAPAWILKSAATTYENWDATVWHDGPRQHGFERLANGQWTLAEIARGEPFRHLLSATG